MTDLIRYSNVYGIDMPSPTELVAHNRTEEEIAKEIGVDLVIYQTLDDLVQSCRTWNPAIETFDCSVFTGEYVTGGVDERYLEHLQKLRSDNAKAKKKSATIHEAEPISEGCNGPMSQSPLTCIPISRVHELTKCRRRRFAYLAIGLVDWSVQPLAQARRATYAITKRYRRSAQLVVRRIVTALKRGAGGSAGQKL